jgi:hypothetical protein
MAVAVRVTSGSSPSPLLVAAAGSASVRLALALTPWSPCSPSVALPCQLALLLLLPPLHPLLLLLFRLYRLVCEFFEDPQEACVGRCVAAEVCCGDIGTPAQACRILSRLVGLTSVVT